MTHLLPSSEVWNTPEHCRQALCLTLIKKKTVDERETRHDPSQALSMAKTNCVSVCLCVLVQV